MIEESQRIPVLIVAGYLGAGKTTLINQMLSSARSRIAVIVNDFGSVNIDAALIAQRHDDTIELTNGCVCCVVGESLTDVLFAISDRPQQPEVIIIEASGVADPSVVASHAHLSGFHLAGVLVLVDAVNATNTSLDSYVGVTFARQVRTADLVAITKSDLATPDQQRSTRNIITELAPQTPVIDVDALTLAELLQLDHTSAQVASVPVHASFSSALLDTSGITTETSLQGFLNSLPPQTVRVKGIVDLQDGSRILVQRVGMYASLTATTLAPTGLVAINAE
jgi:G3E family GTPase